MMRFLSLWRPWPWAIFDAVADKGIENRDWMPPVEMIGQEFAIQAAQKWDNDAIGCFIRLGLTNFPGRKDLYPSGVLVGVATLDRVVTTTKTLAPNQVRWFFGPCGWVLINRVKLEPPVECRGGQGLRFLPPGTEALVRAQLARRR